MTKDKEQGVSTGGVTGSKRVKRADGKFYQVKPTIFDAALKRRLKAGSTDRENFGEVISSTVARNMLVQEGRLEFIPEVTIELNEGKISIASRYIENVMGTLDDIGDRGGRKHIKVSFEEAPEKPKPGVVYLGGNDQANVGLRKEIAQAIAISAFNGDHDVNPGNLIGFSGPDGKPHVARIDFGHAFNDLLNAPRSLGGGVRNKSNQILDFFNRSNVAGFPTPGASKFWRDYEGLIPSDEMINAFKEVADKYYANRFSGFREAKKKFDDLWNSTSDPKLKKHIENSLIAINNAAGGDKITAKDDKIIRQVLVNLENFYYQRCKQMEQAAAIMEIQRDVDKMIKGDPAIKRQDLEAKFKVCSKDNKAIQWFKTSKGTKAFRGNLNELISHRRKVLKIPEVSKAVETSKVKVSKKHLSMLSKVWASIKPRVKISAQKKAGAAIPTETKPRIDQKTMIKELTAKQKDRSKSSPRGL